MQRRVDKTGANPPAAGLRQARTQPVSVYDNSDKQRPRLVLRGEEANVSDARSLGDASSEKRPNNSSEKPQESRRSTLSTTVSTFSTSTTDLRIGSLEI